MRLARKTSQINRNALASGLYDDGRMLGIEATRIEPSSWASPMQLLSGGMIIFLAYEGFELIANSGKDIRDPEKTLPKAFYTAVAFVILLYVAVALVTVGNLSVSKVVDAKVAVSRCRSGATSCRGHRRGSIRG